jgi:hypothetical protein
LATYAYIGRFSRYIADDFCTAHVALSRGLIDSVVWWYTSWAGQFTNWTLKGVVGLAGVGMPALLPALIVLLWTGTAIWSAYQIALALRLEHPRLAAILLGTLTIYTILDGVPSLIQSLYWLGASIPYTLPLAAATFYVGFIIRCLRQPAPARLSWRAWLITAGVLFLAGGLSEVYVIFQIGVLLLAALAVWRFVSPDRQRRVLSLLIVGIISSALALGIIVLAPGNAVRQAAFPRQATLPQSIGQILTITTMYPVTAIGIFAPRALLVAVLLPALIVPYFRLAHVSAALMPQRTRKVLLISAVGAWLVLAVCLAAPIYATGSDPAARVYIMPQTTLAVAAVFWGCVIGFSLRPKAHETLSPLMLMVMAALLLIGPGLGAWKAGAEGAQLSVFAAEWDSRDQTIRAALIQGSREVTVPPFSADMADLANLEVIGPDPQGWANVCAADYYGLQALATSAATKTDAPDS